MSQSVTEYVNLLDVLTKDRELPAGYDAWAIRSVRPDFMSSNGYRYPFPGKVAKAPGPINKEHRGECPSRQGDGICAALTWAGMASGGIPARVLLLVAYRERDVLGRSEDKLRLSKFLVVDVVDGERLVRERGRGANLHGAYMHGANLRGADLSGADLRGADLYGADLYGAVLFAANLFGAYLSGAVLRSASLSGANLRDAYLRGACLRSANLRSANLRSANLFAANLFGADLSGAYLRRADLRSASLRSANLRDADLRGADLYDADLSGANLYGAYLSGADLGDWERGPDGYAQRKSTA